MHVTSRTNRLPDIPVGYWSVTLNDREKELAKRQNKYPAVVWAVLLLQLYLHEISLPLELILKLLSNSWRCSTPRITILIASATVGIPVLHYTLRNHKTPSFRCTIQTSDKKIYTKCRYKTGSLRTSRSPMPTEMNKKRQA